MQGRVLTGRRHAYGFFERLCWPPFFRRSGTVVRPNLIDVPIQLEMVTIRIEELDRDLATCAAPTLEHQLGARRLEMIARAEYLVERRKFESEMVQGLVLAAAVHRGPA